MALANRKRGEPATSADEPLRVCSARLGGGVAHSTPLVSVIIRSVGRTTLAETLESVASQTYPRIEVVLVNAVGRGYPAAPANCGRFPVRFVDGTAPRRRSAAANAGLLAAAGRLIVFLDDDDTFMPGHVAGLQAALQDSGRALAVYSGVEIVGADGTVARVLNLPFSYPRLCVGNFIPIHAVLFSRSLVEAGCRFDESLDLYEDWDFWLQVASRAPFVHLDAVTARYRAGGASGVGLAPERESQSAWRARVHAKWSRLWPAGLVPDVIAALDAELDVRDGLLAARDAVVAAQTAERSRLEERLRALEAWLARYEGSRLFWPLRFVRRLHGAVALPARNGS